jgi:hypothetical protein
MSATAYRGVSSVGIVCPRPNRAGYALNLLMSSLELGSSPATNVDFDDDWSLPSSVTANNSSSSRKGSVSCSPYAFNGDKKCSKELAREQRVMRSLNPSSLSFNGAVDSEAVYPPRAISPPTRSANPVALDSRFGDLSDDFASSGIAAFDSGDIFEFSPSERYLLNH